MAYNLEARIFKERGTMHTSGKQLAMVVQESSLFTTGVQTSQEALIVVAGPRLAEGVIAEPGRVG